MEEEFENEEEEVVSEDDAELDMMPEEGMGGMMSWFEDFSPVEESTLPLQLVAHLRPRARGRSWWASSHLSSLPAQHSES